jgi:hypothetical protein
MLADTAIVEDGHLLADVGVAAVGHPARVLGVIEAVTRAGGVAGRCGRRAATAAQRRHGTELKRTAQMIRDG